VTAPPSDRPTTELAQDLATRAATPVAREGTGTTPLVVVSTSDPGALQRLGLRLYGRATVQPVRGTLELKRFARKNRGCIVVLDCAAPEIDPLDVASALAVVETPTVIVWGASPSTKEELAGSADSAKWVHVGLDTEPAALAELISSLL